MNEKERRMKRGFAKMDPEMRQSIARQGGISAHKMGRAHRFTPESARAAGSKGGLAVSKNIEHMREIGRKGGKARAAQKVLEDGQQSSSQLEDGRILNAE
jgi:general stress protein YciG